MKSPILLSRNRVAPEKTGPTTGSVLLLINCGNNVELQMKFKIYLLRDETRNLRYIGYTKNTLESRLADHVREARDERSKTHKSRGIRRMLAMGLIPTIELITEVKNGPGAEILYIKYFRDRGVDLWNLTVGGDGVPGYRHTPNMKGQISETLKRSWTPERRKAFGLSQMGRSISPTTRKKISVANTGKRRSEETCKKLSLLRKGKPGHPATEETRQKLSIANTGKPCFWKGKHRSEKTRKNMSLARIGMKFSKEHKRNMSRVRIGRIPWNKGMKNGILIGNEV